MYVLDDGRSLQLSLDATSPFCPARIREQVLSRIQASLLPLYICLPNRRAPRPAETELLAAALKVARFAGRRVRITRS